MNEEIGKLKCHKVITDYLELIYIEILSENKIVLPNIGVIYSKMLKATEKHDPRNGNKVLLPTRKSVKFKPAFKLKEAYKQRYAKR